MHLDMGKASWLIAANFLIWTNLAFGIQFDADLHEEDCKSILTAAAIPSSPLQAVHALGRAYTTEVFDRMPKDSSKFYIRPTGDRVQMLKNSKVYVVLLHGLGASYSNPRAMFQPMQVYNGLLFDSRNLPGKTMRAMIREIPSYNPFDTYAESLPIPGAIDYGLAYQDYDDIKLVLSYLKAHIEEAKKHLPEDAIIVVHGRSFSGSLAVELNYQFPELVDKLVLVSPSYPDKASLLDARRKLEAHAQIHEYNIDGPWMDWGIRKLLQMEWPYDEADPFRGTDTLILHGSDDLERTEFEAQTLPVLADNFPFVHYVEIDGAEHDVTSVAGKKKNSGIQAFSHVFPFIRD